MITLKDVTKKYSSDTTIGPLNIDIPAGGITALVGPNGAGKSTMLTMMGRLMQPDSGTITIGGHDVATTPTNELAKVVSILRQENHFVTRLTVRQLVGFGRYPYSKGRLRPEDITHIDQALEFLNLVDLQDRYLDELSGGQRQRAYVAMVLAQDTDYVLLDEPLNNLDMQHSVQMMKQLRRACDELGRTVVVVLHDINFAAAYADHICAMNNGQVTVFGTPRDVMNDETLSHVFHTPVSVFDHNGRLLASYF